MYKICNQFCFRENIIDRSNLKSILKEDISILMDNQIYRETIKVANPFFYENVDITKSISQRTIRNYLKRMVTRSTPYGLFSAVGIGEFNNYSEICDERIYGKEATVDSAWLLALLKKVENDKSVLSEIFVKWNPLVLETNCYYKVKDVNHWGTCKDGSTTTFNIKKNVLLSIINKKTKDNLVSVKDIYEEIKKAGVLASEEELKDYILRLLDMELLLSNLRPAIANERVFESIIEKIGKIDSLNGLYIKLLDIQKMLNIYNQTELGKGEVLLENIFNAMENIIELPNRDYIKVDLVIKNRAMSISQSEKKQLEDFCKFLLEIAPRKYFRNKHIKNYIDEFVEKYGEYVEIPVKDLMDGVIGLGSPFSNFNSSLSVSPIEEDDNEELKLKKFLLKKMYEGDNFVKEINLTEESVKEIYGENRNQVNYPNQIEIYFKMEEKSDNKCCFEIVPGSGGDLKGKAVGRFIQYFPEQSSLMDSEASRIELIVLPNDGRIMNVGNVMHEHMQTLHINTLPNKFDEEKEIDINNIVVGVNKKNDTYELYFRNTLSGEVIEFYSSTMLNPLSDRIYSDLGKLLLCGTREKYINPFGFNRIIETFDDVPHIPRIAYKGIVISCEKWNLSIGERSDEKSILRWKEKWNIPDLVWVADEDERMLVNLKDSDDCRWLIKHKATNLSITEFQDEDRKNKAKEVVFTFENLDKENHILESKTLRKFETYSNKKIKSDFEDDWIYIKLIGVEETDNKILKQWLYPFVVELRQNEILEEFHFVRYYENMRKSLRIRYKCSNREGFDRVRVWTSEILRNELCSDVSFHIYEKEYERYGGENTYAVCEKIFSIDSYAVLSLLIDAEENVINDILFFMHSMFIFLKSLPVSFEEITKLFLERFGHSEFRKEFRKCFPNNDMLIREFGQYFEDKKTLENNAILIKYKNNMKLLNNICEKNNFNSKQVIMSLLHMHFNRMGIDNTTERKMMYFFRHAISEMGKYYEHRRKE